MPQRTSLSVINAIDDVLATTVDLVCGLTETDADLPTDCPGWTVRDQLAHMVGLEQVLGGAPEPDIELPFLEHVSTDIDAYMESHVHVRRSLPLQAIADEMAGMRPRRVAQLCDLAAAGDPLVKGPFGDRPLSASLPIRVFDLWAHEQDIRRAVGAPLRSRGEAATIAVEQSLRSWEAVLPRKAGVLDGELIVDVSGRTPVTIALGDGQSGDDGPSATLHADPAEIVWLACGRGDPNVGIFDGDTDVISAVTPHLGFTP